MGVCDDIPVRFFFFDKAKRQRFILHCRTEKKKNATATTGMRQKCRRKITGQRYFKNGCVRHVIDTARGEKSLL